MIPASNMAAATIQQFGRRLASSYVNNDKTGVVRVASLIGSIPSNSSKDPVSGSPPGQLSERATELAKAQKRGKSSMAIEYDEPDKSLAAALANATYDQSIREPFPSIVLGPEQSVEPQGSFAEAQAEVRRIEVAAKRMMHLFSNIK